MSNALAIAAVTAVLRDLLNNGVVDHDLSTSVGGVTVSSLPPDRILTGESEETRLNLFLYHVTPNAAWRNAGLPAYDSGGTRVGNPPLALDLHYLLSAYGASELHQEILLGYGMQLLHETPLLTRDAVRRALAPTSPLDPSPLPPAFQALSAADLADQVEVVKITPEGLSTEEVSKLWTAFQARYRPTAAYRASVVLIDARRSTRVALPVRGRRLYVVPLQQPLVERVVSASGDTEPILAESRVVLRGQRLRAATVRVRVGDGEVTPAAADLAPTSIAITLPAGLRAGVQGAQVLHLMQMGEPETPHRGVESNVAAFVLAPRLAGIDAGTPDEDGGLLSGEFAVEVDPPVAAGQRVALVLNERGAPGSRAPFAYTLPAPALVDTAEASELAIPFTGVQPGSYLVRVTVDGAASPLEIDDDPDSGTFNQYVAPEVTL
ncbi:MAG TPA: DUF4255 domain-containing protein [Longimicrobium sp.]|jgi:hypothetical protein